MAAEIVLVRHGETEWSRDHKHTSTTDLSLTEKGRSAALALKGVLAGRQFDAVLSSPMRRAVETSQLALDENIEVTLDEDLVEWNYGKYEGVTTPEIHERFDRNWNLWTDGCPDGENPAEVATRADRVISRILTKGSVACFAHGHILRVLAARWVEMGPEAGARFGLDTATISVLGYERDRRILRQWNLPTSERARRQGSPDR